jgi:STE24 endopeptidase
MGNVASWWIVSAIALVGFSLLISWLYPTLIAPIFNKFSPLEDPQLKDRILRLMDETGFQSRGIFLMDGSRRSAHGNAYFTGLGNNKRVVFFDTLLEQLNPEEIEAVLAHELGHFRKKHILKGMLLSAVMITTGFLILSQLMNWPGLYQLALIEQPSNYTALLLFVLLSPHITLWLSPLLNGISRRHEYEADAFAAEHAQPASLIQALIKLYRENANPVITDSIYSLFHDSHPPASLRIQQLQTP